MRFVAMKLHTRDQAPKEGGQPASPQPMQKWEPSHRGYLQFLAESQVVYTTLDSIIAEAEHPEYAKFQNTGLERSEPLQHDIKWMQEKYNLDAPQISEDGPGNTYAKFLLKAAKEDPPVFICHFYNFYFAHTAGGRMIGSKISSMILDNANLQFYQYDGDYKPYLENVRDSINTIADDWTRESKDHCLEETKNSFSLSNGLLRLIFSSDEAQSAQPGSYSKAGS